MLTSYAVNITSTLAFGIDLNTLEHGKNELQEHIQRVFTMLNFRLFCPIPYWRWIRLPPDRRLEHSWARSKALSPGSSQRPASA